MIFLVESGVDKNRKCQKIKLEQYDSHAVLICTACHCHHPSTEGIN
jgi:hypothetical protein